MSTEERDESQPRPKKVIPSIRRENTDQEGERRPYNQGYNKPEGSYERRPYRSYGENNRPSYGDRPSRPRSYDNNREGGYGNNREGGYGNSRPSYGNNREGGYGNNRPSYGNNREGGYNSGRSSYGNNRPSYGNGGGQYNRPSRPNYDGPAKAYSASPSGEGMSADGMKKRRPRVGDTRLITMIHVQAAGTVTHPDVRMVTITLMAVIVKGVVDMEIIAVLLTIIIAVPVEEVASKDRRDTTFVRNRSSIRKSWRIQTNRFV